MGTQGRVANAFVASVGIVVFSFAAGGDAVVADCRETCAHCSADPSFIQPDQRQIAAVLALREAAARGQMVLKKGDMVLIIEDPTVATQKPAKTKGTQVVAKWAGNSEAVPTSVRGGKNDQ